MRRCKIFRYVAATRTKNCLLLKVLAKLAFFIFRRECRDLWRKLIGRNTARRERKQEEGFHAWGSHFKRECERTLLGGWPQRHSLRGLVLIGVLPSIVAEVAYDLQSKKRAKTRGGIPCLGVTFQERVWENTAGGQTTEAQPQRVGPDRRLSQKCSMICSVMVGADKHRGSTLSVKWASYYVL